MNSYESLEEIKQIVPEMIINHNINDLERTIYVMNLQLGEKEEKTFVDTCNYFKFYIRSAYHSKFIITFAYLLANDYDVLTYSNKEKLLLTVPFLDDEFDMRPFVRNRETLELLSEKIPNEELSSIDQISSIFDYLEERVEEVEPYKQENTLKRLQEEIKENDYQELKNKWEIKEYPSQNILDAIHQINPKL